MKKLTVKEIWCDLGKCYEIECEDFLVRFTDVRRIGKGIYLYDHKYHYGGEREDGSEIPDNLGTYHTFISADILSNYEIVNEAQLREFKGA